MMLIVVIGLLAYRLGVLLAEEEGPFRLAERWRNCWLRDDWMGRGVRCVGCVSFWLAAIALWLPNADVPGYLAWPAAAGLARVLWRIAP